MEYWVGKADDVLILISIKGQLFKSRSHCVKPSFPTLHYSNTPWHWITVLAILRMQGLSITRCHRPCG